jgi:class 3 adenylate cyclase/tetratricopeptide (TPR) repeat protein
MRCSACGAAVEGRFRFCPECGTRLPTVDAAATVASGPPPPTAALDGERRQVTVLFCDLVGSTAIAERLDPEEYHDLLQKYLTVSFPAIYRFEGVVNTLAGDGLMALFGAPVAHEDDPQRAVRAALAVREAIRGLAERVSAEGGPALTVRIGVHTGPVVVGGFGTELKRDYTAIGDTTNVAARLQTLAAPGSILVSDATFRLTNGFFEFSSAGELTVKGKSEPVRAYEVLRRQATATAMSIAAERGLTPLAGRGAELQRLEDAYAALARGQAQVVTVVGEAGLGKSRLVHEFRQRLAEEPVVFFESYCSSMSQAIPYHATLSMLRRYFGIELNEPHEQASGKLAGRLGVPIERLEAGYPLLTRILSRPYVERRDAPPDELKRETYDAIARLLVGVSQDNPVILQIEDIHWSDEASRDLLAALVATLERSRVMVLVTTRPEGRPVWRTRAVRSDIALAPLADGEVRAMARAIVGGALPREIEDGLIARAAGSPFFAEEFTRALVEDGDLVCENGTCRLARTSLEIPIPSTVQEVIAARLDRLPPPAKRLLQVASVLGRQFLPADAAALADDAAIDLQSAVAELERRGLVHRKHGGGEDELRFGESVTQEVAYAGLLLRQRRQLHDRAASLLEHRVGSDGMQRSAMVAYHRARGDDRRAAVDALLAATRDAEAVPSYLTAAQFYDQAATAAERATAEGEAGFEPAALEGLFGVARLVVFFGLPMVPQGAAAAERGRVLAERLGAEQELCSLLYYQGILTMSLPGGDFARGLALAEEARDRAASVGLQPLAQRIGRGLALNYALDGRFNESMALIAPNLAEIEASQDGEPPSDLYLTARWVWAFVQFAADNLDAAALHASHTLSLAEQVGNRTMQSVLNTVLSQVELARAEYDMAMQHADRALELAETIGNVNVMPAAGAAALLARTALGQPVDVAEYLDRIERGLDPHGLVQMNFRFVSEAWLLADNVEPFLQRLDLMRQGAGGRIRRAVIALGRGELLGRLGRIVEAREAYTESLSLAKETGIRSLLAQIVVGASAMGEPGMSLVRPHLPATLIACRELGLERYRPRVEELLLTGLSFDTPAERSSA